MAHYLILAVTVKRRGNPFRPLSYIDLGHVDVILWTPSQLPATFGLYPESPRRVVLSALFPQRARLVRSSAFTRVPAYWHFWVLSEAQFAAVKRYLQSVAAGCADGSVRYDAIRFNCLHLAHRCLQTAGLNPPSVPAQRVWFAWTIVPLSFINAVMPDARHSIMDYDLDYREEIMDASTSSSELHRL